MNMKRSQNESQTNDAESETPELINLVETELELHWNIENGN